jgi:hypothetical protein
LKQTKDREKYVPHTLMLCRKIQGGKVKQKILHTFLVIAVVLAASLFYMDRVAKAGHWSTAYKVDVAFWEPWYNPHYGAFHNGSYGTWQYFDGPSGSHPDYGSWDWWGGSRDVLLLEKSWLFASVCFNPGTGYYGPCPDRFASNFHHAWMAWP